MNDKTTTSIVPNNEFKTWLNRNKALPRRMLVLNSVALTAHLLALVFELSSGMRVSMRLMLYRNEPVVYIGASGTATQPFAYARVVDGALPVAVIAILIHAVSMLAHGVVVLSLAVDAMDTSLGHKTPTHHSNWYMSGLFRCRAPWRWAEYLVSSTLMVLVLAAAVGVRDTSLLWTTCALNATTMTFGWLTEVVSSHHVREPNDEDGADVDEEHGANGGTSYTVTRKWKKGTRFERLTPHLLGYIPFAVMFGTVVNAYVVHRHALGDKYNAWADEIVFGSLTIFALFGTVQLAQQLSDAGPSWYAAGETVYVVLSFVAKAWLVVLLNEQVLKSGSPYGHLVDARFD